MFSAKNLQSVLVGLKQKSGTLGAIRTDLKSTALVHFIVLQCLLQSIPVYSVAFWVSTLYLTRNLDWLRFSETMIWFTTHHYLYLQLESLLCIPETFIKWTNGTFFFSRHLHYIYGITDGLMQIMLHRSINRIKNFPSFPNRVSRIVCSAKGTELTQL